MNTALCTLTMLLVSATATAEVPQDADAINGAFERMFAHEPVALATQRLGADQDGLFVERWVNSTARGDYTGLEAGFVHMLERSRDEPRRPLVRREPDALATMIAAALDAQRMPQQQFAGRPAGPSSR